jgi:uncharacterized protein DUF2779
MEQLPLWSSTPPAKRKSIPLLSKSRFAAGLQCSKRLYLECYGRDKMDPIDPSRRVLLDAGHRIGRIARGRFPGGRLIAEDHFHHDEAVRSTAAAMEDPGVRAVYEAAFVFDDVRVRIDVLSRGAAGWDLIEVKSSAGYKDEYLPDIAMQLYVAEGSGVRIGTASLLHINTQYIYPGGAYDLGQLFTRIDLSDPAREARGEILERLSSMRAPLWAETPPDIAIGAQCTRPYVCPFYSHCHEGGPEHPLYELPYRNARLTQALEAANVRDIREIPDDFAGLNAIQRRIRSCVIEGTIHADPELRAELTSLRPPVVFLDFETCNPALPILPGTRPFQQIPFQWSAHAVGPDGALSHREFLHDRLGEDPRGTLARALLEALEGAGSIVVYSGYEERIIRALAQQLPELAPRLLGLLDVPLVDLLALIKAHYYHPGFHGSFSIKDVLPVLAVGHGYTDLAIRDGNVAGSAYLEMSAPETPEDRRREIRDALRAYCRRDTEAMVRLFHALKEGS